MKKFNTLYKTCRQKIVSSSLGMALLINICFIVLVFVLCDSKYEVSDDFVMASILSGAYGDGPNPHMIFVNVILGYLLMPLYYLFPQVSWYYVFQILVIFLSAVTIIYLLFEWTECMSAKVLAILFLTVFAGDAYILVQFVKTAIWAVMAGAILFIWALFYRKRFSALLWGGFLCLVGAWIRFSVIYIAGVFIFLVLCYEFIKLFSEQKITKKIIVDIFRILTVGVILIVIAYAGQRLDSYIYNNNEEYRYFREYSLARSKIVDHVIEDYSIYSEELQKLGVSENDFYMITTWSFADNQIFSLETLEKISKVVLEKERALRGGFTDVLNDIQSREFLKYPVCIACLLLLGLSIFLNYKKWWMMLASLAGGGLLLFYFSYRGRSVYRVEYATFLAVFVCGLYFWQNQKKLLEKSCVDKRYIRKTGKSVLIVLCIGSMVLYVPDREYKYVDSQNRKNYIDNNFYASWNYGTGKLRKVVNRSRPESSLLKEIKENPQNFYFLDFNTTIQTLYFEWYPWEAVSSGFYNNVLYLGGITSNFPDVNRVLKERGYSNQLKSLVNKNVYLIDNKGVEQKVNFLREHYYPGARAELYKEIDGYEIWKIYEQ